MTVMCLSDLGQVVTGNTPSKSIDDFYDSEDICFVKPSDFYSNSLSKIDKTENYLSEKARCVSRIVPKGSILVTCIGIIGKVAVLNGDAAFNQQINAIIPDKKKVLPMYLAYSLLSKQQELAWQANAAVVPIINKSQFSKLQLDIPDIDSQNKIISVLSKVDTLTTKVKKQLEDFDLLIKSRFIEMFGDISTNTKGWNQVPLGELCDISRGGSPRPINNFLGGTVPWIKIGDATDGDNIYLTKTKEHIIEDGVKKSHLVKKGSLIFANCGVSLGFARIITFDGCIHDGWLAFENISASIDKRFVLLTLNMLTKYFRNIAPDGTQPNLNTSIMKKHKQIVPPLTLQKEFVQFVIQVDKSKLAVQQSLKELEILKKSLMQQYFG